MKNQVSQEYEILPASKLLVGLWDLPDQPSSSTRPAAPPEKLWGVKSGNNSGKPASDTPQLELLLPGCQLKSMQADVASELCLQQCLWEVQVLWAASIGILGRSEIISSSAGLSLSSLEYTAIWRLCLPLMPVEYLSFFSATICMQDVTKVSGVGKCTYSHMPYSISQWSLQQGGWWHSTRLCTAENPRHKHPW